MGKQAYTDTKNIDAIQICFLLSVSVSCFILKIFFPVYTFLPFFC